MTTRDEPSLDRCSREQLSALLSLAARHASVRPLPALAFDVPGLRRLLSEMTDEESRPAEHLLQLVCEAGATLEQLRQIKSTAKRLLRDAPTREHRDALTFVYHAAVAAAYGLYGVNMSSRSILMRLGLYEDLADTLRGDPLSSIFAGASRRAMVEAEDAG